MAHGLELLGERWAMFIVRELLLGPRRFGDLRADLPQLSANVLTQRLNALETRGIVERTRLPPPANVPVYGLTQWGYEAEPLILQLGKWAARSPTHDPTLPLSAVSILLSMKAMIDIGRVRALSLSTGFQFGDRDYHGRIDRSGITIAAGQMAYPDLAYTGTPEGMAARIHGKQPLAMLAHSGVLQVRGDAALEQRFVDLFHLPPKAGSSPPKPRERRG